MAYQQKRNFNSNRGNSRRPSGGGGNRGFSGNRGGPRGGGGRPPGRRDNNRRFGGGGNGRRESFDRRGGDRDGGRGRRRDDERGQSSFNKSDFVRRRAFLMERARDTVQEAYTKPDAPLVQATRTIDDLDNVKSLLYQRLMEWVQLNFPEMELKNEESVCRLYAEFGDKKFFDEAFLREHFGKEKAADLMAKIDKSFGAEFVEADKMAVEALSRRVLDLFLLREEMLSYVQTKARKEMPNTCELIEPLLAARLLSLAGNLEKMSAMPASTVQLLGAEKALFKHLKNRRIAPPKHGILFQSPLINSAPLNKRGKVARALATKVTIAARADYFTKNDVGTKLREDLDKRIAEINSAKTKK